MDPVKIDNILISDDLKYDLQTYFTERTYKKIFVIVDENTEIYCLPAIIDSIPNAVIINTKSGDENKTIDTLIRIWECMWKNEADRRSTLIINLGGGVICDIGGFAASTYKRGISYINIPTTLLAQADAAIGGKTGINFQSVKNLIGSFCFPDRTFIDPGFLKTTGKKNFLSGFAEIIKHSLISENPYWDEIKSIDPETIGNDNLKTIIQKSIRTKMEFVRNDPFEERIRKVLNFGHTFGHAFESLFLEKNNPVLHGYAIAAGIVCELYLSVLKLNFDIDDYLEISDYIRRIYGKLHPDPGDFDLFFNFMKHDKKNFDDLINFTLIKRKGNYKIDNFILKDEIFITFVKYLNN